MAETGAHPFSLAGKTVLVAGGASGIGASTAAVCAGLGAKLILADISDATPVADRLRRDGHQASAASCDVTNRASVERLVSGAGALDAMVVCSGICPFDDWTADDWDDVYERTNAVNVKGTVNCVRAALPGMMERGSGRIVLVGSLAGRSGGLLSARTMSHPKARSARWCAGSPAKARRAMFWSTASRPARSIPG
jgi:3-oxoacyl-[acyl-carrier protein] reductase